MKGLSTNQIVEEIPKVVERYLVLSNQLETARQELGALVRPKKPAYVLTLADAQRYTETVDIYNTRHDVLAERIEGLVSALDELSRKAQDLFIPNIWYRVGDWAAGVYYDKYNRGYRLTVREWSDQLKELLDV
jgi:hypothetical protein